MSDTEGQGPTNERGASGSFHEDQVVPDSEVYTSMYAEVLNGIPKQESRFRDVPGFSSVWDQIVAEIARVRADHPDWRFDLPLD